MEFILKCRSCHARLTHSFVDLGMSPLANSYLRQEDLQQQECFYPLHAFVCSECFLVQLPALLAPDQFFSHYAYFSSYSATWLEHAQIYVENMMGRFRFDSGSQVIEIGSNDGYLLQYFKKKGVPVLGVEPAKNVAKVAQAANIPTIVKFFGIETAAKLVAEGFRADLVIANNVLAQAPALDDFVKGMKTLLKPQGIITLEFPHLLKLMEENQFDTIYHEHFSYFSFIAVQRIFSENGLSIFDVEELPTHGGSLRLFLRHDNDDTKFLTERVEHLKHRELQAGLNRMETYSFFAPRVRETKRELLKFLIEIKQAGKSVVGYGAPAKGNTLLNYCGIRSDFIDYTVDRSPHKQNQYLPGTHIPIYHPDKVREAKPDYLLILPWNLKKEVMAQMQHIREWGGKFVVPIPKVEVYS
jgi:2-polyprenyl-3-methyl-5-hydroxy-6-metoxy-1,4-benzoquinol methylase